MKVYALFWGLGVTAYNLSFPLWGYSVLSMIHPNDVSFPIQLPDLKQKSHFGGMEVSRASSAKDKPEVLQSPSGARGGIKGMCMPQTPPIELAPWLLEIPHYFYLGDPPNSSQGLLFVGLGIGLSLAVVLGIGPGSAVFKASV